MNSEPAIIMGVVNAAATLIGIFGFHLTSEQIAAVATVATIITTLITRAHVSPTPKA